MQHAVAHQNESGVVGHLAPLMKIEGQRVRALDALEPRRQIRSQNRQRAKRAIHVEPKPLAAADAGQGVQIVDRPGVDGAGRAHHQERRKAGAAIRFDGFFQCAFRSIRWRSSRESGAAHRCRCRMSMAFPMQLWAATEV
jgi:hypothetical protein